jgi:hypothetical protein
MRINRAQRSALLVLLVLILVLMGGWGSLGHKVINSSATMHLPQTMLGLIQQSKRLGDSASVADNRKGSDPSEAPKHFMDVDDYPDFATRTVKENLDSLILQYGSTRVYTNGISPWAARWALDSLTQQMKRGEWSKAWSSAADLGHYVGDIHQPLHNAKNYDGQLTGNNGIHSRYETSMLAAHQSSLVIQPRSASYVSNPTDYLFTLIYQSQTYVDSIIAADNYAKQASGWNGVGNPSTPYYDALWSRTGTFTVLQLQRATEAFANLMYTAWINAGTPTILTDVEQGKEERPLEISLYQNYPNPFNPSTDIRYRLNVQSRVRIAIYDILGREMAVLVDQQKTAGTHHAIWDAANSPSGLYLYQLRVGNDVHTRKMILTK